MPVRFIDPRYSDDEEIVGIGNDFTRGTLMQAYRNGIFPWPSDDDLVFWFSPLERAVIEFSGLHVPRSLRKARERTAFTFTIDRAFPRVMLSCARVERAGRPGTWIIDEMIEGYCALHDAGHAHSVEVWEGNDLVGGLYGIDVDGVFAGESMFHLRPNASKLALLHLIDHIASRGGEWIDIQTMTPHMETLGAFTLPRPRFLEKLGTTRARGLRIFDGDGNG